MPRGEHCSSSHVQALQRALAWEQEACRRFESNPASAKLADRRDVWCDDNTAYELQNCAGLNARAAEYEREAQAMQAQMFASIQQSLRDVSAIGTGVAAAKAGLVPVYQPGGAAGTVPVIYVNPATNKQWSSPGLAYIATRLPKRKPAPGPAIVADATPAPAPSPAPSASGGETTAPVAPAHTQAVAGAASRAGLHAGAESPYHAGDPSTQPIVGYWNPKNGRVDVVQALSGDVDASLEMARTQCRFFSDAADKEACEPMTTCAKKGHFSVAVGKGDHGKFRISWACGASSREASMKGAVEQCSKNASGCVLAAEKHWEIHN